MDEMNFEGLPQNVISAARRIVNDDDRRRFVDAMREAQATISLGYELFSKAWKMFRDCSSVEKKQHAEFDLTKWRAEVVRIVDADRPCYIQKRRGRPKGVPEGFTKVAVREVVRVAIANLNLKISNDLRRSLESRLIETAPKPTSETEHFIVWD
jgi:hypothetical protein